MKLFALAALVISACPLFGQETVDNSNARNVRPWPILDHFPGVCRYGEKMTYSLGTIGSNDYTCGKNNDWNLTTGAAATPISTYAIASLPTAPATDTIAQVKDAVSTTDCTVGGASGGSAFRHLCSFNGTTWVLSGSAGAGLPAATAANQALVATGAGTTYTPVPLANVATSGVYSDLSGKPTIPTAGSGASNFVPGNSVGAASGIAPLDAGSKIPLANVPGSGVITVAGTPCTLGSSCTPTVAATLPTASSTGQVLAATAPGSTYAPTTLAPVASSGSYTDLSGKPTIPTAGTTSSTYAAGNDTRITGAVQSTAVGSASGVAPLGSDSKVPLANVPGSGVITISGVPCTLGSTCTVTGSGGIAASTAVTDTATPTYTVLANTATQGFTVDLSPGVPITGGTLVGTNATDGEQISFSFGPQPSTPVSVAFPANVTSAGAVDQTAGATTTVTCKWNAATSTAKFCGATTSDASTPKLITTTGHTITFPDVNATAMTTVTPVVAAQLPALTGDCSTPAGANTVTCGSAIARTGVDVNSANQVATTHLAAPLPFAQGGVNATTPQAAAANIATGITAAPIVLGPTDNVQAVINAHAPGTHYIYGAGVYQDLSITPQAGDFHTAQAGVIARGAKTLTGAISDGHGNYYYAGQTQNDNYFGASGICNDGTSSCQFSNGLWVDFSPTNPSAPLARLPNIAADPTTALTAGTWVLNSADNRIFANFGFDPATHLIETSTGTSYAFIGTNPNVTISGFTVLQYGNLLQSGCVAAGDGWKIDAFRVYGCHGRGIGSSGNNVSVTNSRLAYNGQMGGGGLGNDVLYDNNEIDHNNTAGVSGAFESGGLKMSGSQRFRFTRNNVHHNFGEGAPWMDGSNDDFYIAGNNVHDNAGPGMHFEQGHGGEVAKNTVANNGTGSTSALSYPQMWLVNSNMLDIHDNVVDAGATNSYESLFALAQDTTRGGDPAGVPFLLAGNNVHHNQITLRNGAVQFTAFAGNISGNAAGNATTLNPTEQIMDWNNYHLPSISGPWFISGNCGSDQSFLGFQKCGWETHGTVDTVNDGSAGFTQAYLPKAKNKGRYVWPAAPNVTMDLTFGDPEILVTQPIYNLKVDKLTGNVPFSLTLCNDTTVYPVTFDPMFSSGAVNNAVTAAKTCSTQTWRQHSSGLYLLADPALTNQARTGYFAADTFLGSGGVNIVGQSLLSGGVWVQGDAAGGGNNYYTGNGGVTNNSNYNSAYTSVHPTSANYTVQADLLYPFTPNGNEESALVVRSTNNAGAGYFGQYRLGAFSINSGYGGSTTGTPVTVALTLGVFYQMIFSVKTNTTTAANADLTLIVIRKTDNYFLTSSGAWQAAPAVAVTAANDSSGWTAAGSVGFVMSKGTAQPQFNNFFVTLN